MGLAPRDPITAHCCLPRHPHPHSKHKAFDAHAVLLRKAYVACSSHGSVAEVDHMFMVTTAQMRAFLMGVAGPTNTPLMDTKKNEDRSCFDTFLEESRRVADDFLHWEHAQLIPHDGSFTIPSYNTSLTYEQFLDVLMKVRVTPHFKRLIQSLIFALLRRWPAGIGLN